MRKTVLLCVLGALVVIGGIMVQARYKKNAVVENTPIVNPMPTITETAIENKLPADGTYTVAPDKSTAAWQGSKPRITDYIDTGTLGIKSGSFTITDAKLVSGSLVFDMSTIKTLMTGKKTGEGMMEKHLKSADFFDVEKYPTAQLIMKEAIPGSTPGNYTVKGDLTIKGVTNAVEIPVTVASADKTLMIDSTVTLDRTKWNIRYGSGQFFKDLADNVIADNFTVIFKLVANAQ